MESTRLEQNYRDAANVFDNYVKDMGTNTEVKTKRWIEDYMRKNGVEPDTFFLPSDLCYNHTTKPLGGSGNEFENSVHLFEYKGRNKYRILGSQYPYSGKVTRKRKDGVEVAVGEWENGKLIKWNIEEVMK